MAHKHDSIHELTKIMGQMTSDVPKCEANDPGKINITGIQFFLYTSWIENELVPKLKYKYTRKD